MFTRGQLKDAAKGYFNRNYWGCVGFPLMIFALSFIASLCGSILYVVGPIAIAIVLTLPLEVSVARFFLNNRDGNASMDNLEFPFKNSYGNIIQSLFLTRLFIWLWSLLLWVPGIIKAYQYSQVVYIMSEHPDLNYKDAQKLSRDMMEGYKMELFMLQLSFIGWWLLGSLTGGILYIFYVTPYCTQTMAEFYVAVRDIYYYNNGQPECIMRSKYGPFGGGNFQGQANFYQQAPMYGQGQPMNPMYGQGQPMNPMYGQGQPMNPMYGQGQPMNQAPMYGQGQPMNQAPMYGQGQPMNQAPMYGQGQPMNQTPMYDPRTGAPMNQNPQVNQGPKFDPQTGAPIYPADAAEQGPKFDSQTGAPIYPAATAEQGPKFDPQTGEPIYPANTAEQGPKFDPQTGEPIGQAPAVSLKKPDASQEPEKSILTFGTEETESEQMPELHSETKADPFEFSNPFADDIAPTAPETQNPFDEKKD